GRGSSPAAERGKRPRRRAGALSYRRRSRRPRAESCGPRCDHAQFLPGTREKITMALEITLRHLVGGFERLREEAGDVAVTVREDHTREDESVLVDKVGTSLDDLAGYLEETLSGLHRAWHETHRANLAALGRELGGAELAFYSLCHVYLTQLIDEGVRG